MTTTSSTAARIDNVAGVSAVRNDSRVAGTAPRPNDDSRREVALEDRLQGFLKGCGVEALLPEILKDLVSSQASFPVETRNGPKSYVSVRELVQDSLQGAQSQVSKGADRYTVGQDLYDYLQFLNVHLELPAKKAFEPTGLAIASVRSAKCNFDLEGRLPVWRQDPNSPTAAAKFGSKISVPSLASIAQAFGLMEDPAQAA